MNEEKQVSDFSRDTREIRLTFHNEFARILAQTAAGQLTNQGTVAAGQAPAGKGGGVQVGPGVQAGPGVQVGPLVQLGPLVQTGGSPVPVEEVASPRIVVECGARPSKTTFEVKVEETESFAFTPGARREREACTRLKTAAETMTKELVLQLARDHGARHRCQGECPDGEPCNSTPQVAINDPEVTSECDPLDEGYVWDTLTARATAQCTVTVECKCPTVV